ncbi:hypothetical protein Cgig2_025164 [Carnegiea gigantea]|uniref:Midasin n=1 Tax=Carnegiea gigantea TaxID=171969 RepID=A0A9Q1KSG7_9CARY|nr:hypothetical protein Cgig2_025164 [Carnegiea gigantea]
MCKFHCFLLLCALVSQKEEQDASNELPGKNDKGIEMEQDFDAGTFSVSEDSGDDEHDDNGDDEAEQLDSAMGNTGDDSEVVDEKLWNKEEDENLDGGNGKDESGPSMKDRDPNNRELRAKDESDARIDDLAEGNDIESDKDDEMNDDKDAGNDAPYDKLNTEDMNVDKEEASADHTGLDLNEPNQTSVEDADEMEVEPTEDPMDGDGAKERDDQMDGDAEDNAGGPEDEILEKGESDQVGGSEKDDAEKRDDENGNMDFTAPSRDMYEPGNTGTANNQLPNTETSPAMNDEGQEANSMSAAHEMMWSMNSDVHNDLASSENASQIEVMMGNSSKGNLTNDQTMSHLPQQDFSSFQKNQPNPLRDLGDALQDWKDRVKVSADIPDTKTKTADEMVDEEANEYGFTSKLDKGRAQALGSALPDQVDHSMTNEKPYGDGVGANEEDKFEDFQKQDTDAEPVTHHPILVSRMEEKIKMRDSLDEMPVEDIQEAHSKKESGPGGHMESVISLKKSYVAQDMNQASELSTGGDKLGKVQNLVQQFNDTQMSAAAVWRKYELRTSRLSQELAEQLRLVMEHTLASKLQGDYRTGKRINMKKVNIYCHLFF